MKDNEELLKMLREQGYDIDKILDLDDTFNFKCQRCGSCCKERGDILIEPFDVYIGSKHLGIEPINFLKKCNFFPGGQSKIPIFSLGVDKNGWCHFLEYDKETGLHSCSLGKSKPKVCYNHPIGTMQCSNSPNEDKYIIVDTCDNSQKEKQEWAVRDWIAPTLKYKEEYEISRKLRVLVLEYLEPKKIDLFSEIINGAFSYNIIKRDFDELFSAYLSTFYMLFSNYDTSKPFIEQAEENIKTVTEAYKTIAKHFGCFERSFEEVLQTKGANLNELYKRALGEK